MNINTGVSNISFKSVYTISGDMKDVSKVEEKFIHKKEQSERFSSRVKFAHLGYGNYWPNTEYGAIIVTTGEDAKKYTKFITEWKPKYWRLRKIVGDHPSFAVRNSDAPAVEEEKEAKACLFAIENICDFSSKTKSYTAKDALRAIDENKFDYFEGIIRQEGRAQNIF